MFNISKQILFCLTFFTSLIFSIVEADPFKVVAYFAEWGIYARNYQVKDIPAEKLTHINYAFAKIVNGEVSVWDDYAALDKAFPGDTWDEPLRGNFKQMKLLKMKHPHLKTFISVGGWTGSGEFSELASTEEGRRKFAQSALRFIQKYEFDGVDIDWEFPVVGGLQPGFPKDAVNFTLLIEELRRVLGSKYLLTIAMSGGPAGMDAIDFKKVISLLDWVNIMTYDYHGAWEAGSGFTGHNSPLFDSGDLVNTKFNIDSAVSKLLEAGIPSEKIVIGLAFYGRSASGVQPNGTGLYASFQSAGPASFEPGVLDYKDIKANYLTNDLYIANRDDMAQVPYLYNPTDRVFVSYDDPESIRIKILYAKQRKLGGVMFWELSGDNGDLVNSIHQAAK